MRCKESRGIVVVELGLRVSSVLGTRNATTHQPMWLSSPTLISLDME